MPTSSVPAVRSPWPIASLGACVLLLCVPLVFGNLSARIGAVIGLVGMFAGLSLSVRRLRRVEHGESEPGPRVDQLVSQAIAGMTVYFVCLAAYLAFVLAAVASGPQVATGTLAAAGAAVALSVAITFVARRRWLSEGVERVVFLEATCIAFFVTVVGSGGYALFEVLAGAPRISLWAVWSVGMLAWVVAGAVRGHRVR